MIRCSSWISTRKWKKSSYYNLIDLFLHSEASLRDKMRISFMTHEQKQVHVSSKKTWLFRPTHGLDAAGGSSRVMLGGGISGYDSGGIVIFFSRICGGCSGATSPTSESMPWQFKRRPCRKSGKMWEESLNIRFGARKISHTWIFATCEAWVNSTNIEACRRMMVSWRRCQMVSEASKQYGCREAGGITTQIVQKNA